MDDFFSKLLLISNTIDELDIKIKKTKINFELSEGSFNFVFNECKNRMKRYDVKLSDKFDIQIGELVIEFSMSNI